MRNFVLVLSLSAMYACSALAQPEVSDSHHWIRLAENEIYKTYAHLPKALQKRSRPFCELAGKIIDTAPRNAERTVALRKLLEAKDAAVRAAI